MSHNKIDIIKKLEEYIQHKTYTQRTAKEIENTLKIFYTVDKKSLLKYIDILFDSDFEKSKYAHIFISFLCSISSDNAVLLIEKVYKRIHSSELKKLIIRSCPNTKNYKINYFLFKLTDDINYSNEAKLSLLDLGDDTYERELLKEYANKLELDIFLSEYLNSLSKSGSKKVWELTSRYVEDERLDEKVRYRIFKFILTMNDKDLVYILINLYKYYKQHPELTKEDLLDFSIKISSIKKDKEKKFIDKILDEILSKLKEYYYLPEVKSFLDRHNIEPKK